MILTTDHGLAFPGAKATLTDRGIGVLLIMRGPGGFHGGRVSDALVSQVDLFPTICELLGIERPALAARAVAARSESQRRGLCGDHLPRRLRAAARGAHEALQVHPALRDGHETRAREHRRQPQQGLLLAHGLAERDAPPEAALRPRVRPQRGAQHRRRSEHARSRRSCARGSTRWMEETGDPLLRRPDRARAGHRVSTRPTSAPRPIRRRSGTDGARDRPPDPGRRPARAARRTGRRGAGSRSTSCASTATSRLPGPARARTSSVALGSGATAAGGGPAVGRGARSSGCARPTPPALPVLGICFGAQALAAALGGCVHRLPSARGRLGHGRDQRRRPRPGRPVDGLARGRLHAAAAGLRARAQRVRRAGVLPLPPPRGAVPPRGHAGDRRRDWAVNDHGDLDARRASRARQLDAATRRHAATAARAADEAVRRLRRPGGARGCSLPRVKHEHTHHVAADADKVYAALADVSNLPHYVPQMTTRRAARRRQGHGRGPLRRPHAARRGVVQDRRRAAPDRVGRRGQRLPRLAPGRSRRGRLAADALRRDGPRRRARPRGHGHARRDPPPRRGRCLTRTACSARSSPGTSRRRGSTRTSARSRSWTSTRARAGTCW